MRPCRTISIWFDIWRFYAADNGLKGFGGVKDAKKRQGWTSWPKNPALHNGVENAEKAAKPLNPVLEKMWRFAVSKECFSLCISFRPTTADGPSSTATWSGESSGRTYPCLFRYKSNFAPVLSFFRKENAKSQPFRRHNWSLRNEIYNLTCDTLDGNVIYRNGKLPRESSYFFVHLYPSIFCRSQLPYEDYFTFQQKFWCRWLRKKQYRS